MDQFNMWFLSNEKCIIDGIECCQIENKMGLSLEDHWFPLSLARKIIELHNSTDQSQTKDIEKLKSQVRGLKAFPLCHTCSNLYKEINSIKKMVNCYDAIHNTPKAVDGCKNHKQIKGI